MRLSVSLISKSLKTLLHMNVNIDVYVGWKTLCIYNWLSQASYFNSLSLNFYIQNYLSRAAGKWHNICKPPAFRRFLTNTRSFLSFHWQWALLWVPTVFPFSFSSQIFFHSCMHAQSLSHVRLFATPWTVAHQAPLSMGFFQQESWSGLPFPSPGDLPHPGIEPLSPVSPALAGMHRAFTRHLMLL